MSAKSVIQSLQDCDLIRIFLDFIQVYRLHYQKSHKEISYKCYEATWVINVGKATGYGRTQTQAYKNALKNMLQLLIEDPNYIEFFSDILPQVKSNGNGKLPSKDPSPPPKMHLKTEGHEPDNKSINQYESFSKVNLVGRAHADSSQSKINLNRSMSQKGDIEMDEARNKMKSLQNRLAAVLEENKILKERLISFEERPSFIKQEKRVEDKKNMEQKRLQQKKLFQEKKIQEQRKYQQQKRIQQQRRIQQKMKLQNQQRRIQQEQRLQQERKIHQQRKLVQQRKSFQRRALMGVDNLDRSNVCLNQDKSMQPNRSQKSFTMIGEKNIMNKLAIPKLNLQVLPNYHKKSEKCLNDVLLAAYNEKHGGQRKLL